MPQKILFVDDDENILSTFKRNLRKKYDVHVANLPSLGIEVFKKHGPFPVVVSDFKMPEMNGVEFLKEIGKLNKDTVKMLLTGYADLDTSLTAINEGHVFRMLTKPVEPAVLIQALEDGFGQYRMRMGEREFVSKTLKGTIQVLTEVLSLANPEAFGRAERAQRIIKKLVKHSPVKNQWRLDLAVMLSQIGCVSISEDILEKVFSGEPLGAEEEQIFQMHPAIAASLLENIPRLEDISKIIQHQLEEYSMVKEIPKESFMLKIALDYDAYIQSGKEEYEALKELQYKAKEYDPELLKALEVAIGEERGYMPKQLALDKLEEGMVIDDDVLTTSGMLIMKKGMGVTSMSLSKLQNFQKSHGVKQPIKVLVPLSKEE